MIMFYSVGHGLSSFSMLRKIELLPLPHVFIVRQSSRAGASDLEIVWDNCMC